ncbi:formate dehydrogenase subunit gamma [Chromobacterium sphagni]|uniref:Formate dehydrogenase subunit gamma n=1 Tax=Chromobacterium sphagni TaxID=1903179 RepID=A0A1S1X0I4_9NEIS|nr:formate dehydrogenase subunit gamma [Chromobacterium sphagni]OHX12838.1 formate dehydrogenase subunit gamma [Chromobacterium sphagni]
MKEQLIQRYNVAERINHWIVAACFILLALSGLGLFYPGFFWLTGVFGTPQLARMIHPFVGVLMFLGFFRQFFRYWRHNLFNGEDLKWLRAVKSVLKGREVGETGKYNAGQKAMFWIMTLCVATMLITGVIAWRPYFAGYFPIPLIRIALLLHACAATLLIASIIVHIYAALWVKGTIRAMVEGMVTHAWAKKHHPGWYKQMMGRK